MASYIKIDVEIEIYLSVSSGLIGGSAGMLYHIGILALLSLGGFSFRGPK